MLADVPPSPRPSHEQAEIDAREAVARARAERLKRTDQVLQACGGNRSRAARELGISRQALQKRLQQLKVPKGTTGRPRKESATTG